MKKWTVALAEFLEELTKLARNLNRELELKNGKTEPIPGPTVRKP